MWILRLLLHIGAGIILGSLVVGFIAALPNPYSLIPLLPVCFALALVLRVPATAYWILLIAVAITDVYRAAGFGVGIFAYAILVYCMQRVTTDFVTHRSLIGCAVIAAGVGVLWPVLLTLFGAASDWWNSVPTSLGVLDLLQAFGIHAVLTVLLATALYALIPRWWIERSPTRLGGSHI